MTPHPPRHRTERDTDFAIREALSGVLDHGDEYPVRYVIIAETVRADIQGEEHHQHYKIVPPGATRGDTTELLHAGLSWFDGVRGRYFRGYRREA